MAIKYIISDIDGCLSPEESVAWDMEHFMELARLVRGQGPDGRRLPPMTLCTGRPQPYVETMMKVLDIRLPVICENGAVLYSLHDNWARYARGITEEKVLGLRRLREFIETQILPSQPSALLQFGKEAQISVFSKTPEIFAQITPRLEEFAATHAEVPPLVINASHFYLNISLAGFDKGSALAELTEQLGARRDELAGIGDTEGDLPLREAVGFFACPSNSQPAVKAAADYVSPYPMLHGILDILSRPEFTAGE